MVYIPITEYNLSINEFKEPTVSKDAEAIGTLLVRLLLLEPGTFQSHPKMGVGIASRYRYKVAGEAYRLQSDFKNQIETYLPWFQSVDIKVTEIKHQYNILAEIDGMVFSIYYDTLNGSIKYRYAKLSDVTY